ncbi:MAG: hypothetical protein GY847_19420 [Proteobacteria bacterium]|nr:hypothetical protein [Pseudomonadota bacterium]
MKYFLLSLAIITLGACNRPVNKSSTVEDNPVSVGNEPAGEAEERDELSEAPKEEPKGKETAGVTLCVFDYDLTLSSNKCPDTKGVDGYYCRTNKCGTYSWIDQCLGKDAREAVAECIRRNAYIGIASHADVDGCWNDKVIPIISENQFPELTGSPNYNNKNEGISYPAIDNRDNWNCDTCAYHMNPTLSKPNAIRRIMLHYKMDPKSDKDRARVIFWDDSPSNINAVKRDLKETKAVLVPRNKHKGGDGGCGITRADIDEGWGK